MFCLHVPFTLVFAIEDAEVVEAEVRADPDQPTLGTVPTEYAGHMGTARIARHLVGLLRRSATGHWQLHGQLHLQVWQCPGPINAAVVQSDSDERLLRIQETKAPKRALFVPLPSDQVLNGSSPCQESWEESGCVCAMECDSIRCSASAAVVTSVSYGVSYGDGSRWESAG